MKSVVDRMKNLSNYLVSITKIYYSGYEPGFSHLYWKLAILDHRVGNGI